MYEVSKFSGSLAEELVKVASNISKDDNHRGIADLTAQEIKHEDVEIKLPR